jgi:hypothetical protein
LAKKASKPKKKQTIPDVVEIDTRGVVFYDQLDEAALFWQLDNISCVVDYTPTSFNVSFKKINQRNLWALLACCRRYKIDSTQLAVFGREIFEKWAQPWSKDVFRRPDIKPATKLRRLLAGTWKEKD